MKELKDRIKLIRKEARLTQGEFAQKIGTVQNTITGYETGRRTPSGTVLTLICEKFGINKDWIEHGNGDIYKIPDSRFAALVSEIDDSNDEFIKSFIEVYMGLDESSKRVLKDIGKKMAEKNK